MKEIVIKNQKEWDELSKAFSEPTRVIFQDAEIEKLSGNYNNCCLDLRGSSVVKYMYGSSVVKNMYDSSVVEYMYGSSVVECMYGSSVVEYMYNSSVVKNMRNSSAVNYMHDSSLVQRMYNSSLVKNAFDSATIFTTNAQGVEFSDIHVTIKNPNLKSSFEIMLSRGILRTDGITKKFKQVKQIDKGVKVYFLDDDTFCANNGEYSAHAKSLKMSVIDLRFKMEDRDKSEYEDMTLDSSISFDDAVICYRVITGACSGGVEEFLEQKNINKDELTIGEIVKLTEGYYGHDTFKQFFN